MSLVNQMLQDLERRRETPETARAPEHDGIRPTLDIPVKQYSVRPLIISAAGAACILAAFALWQGKPTLFDEFYRSLPTSPESQPNAPDYLGHGVPAPEMAQNDKEIIRLQVAESEQKADEQERQKAQPAERVVKVLQRPASLSDEKPDPAPQQQIAEVKQRENKKQKNADNDVEAIIAKAPELNAYKPASSVVIEPVSPSPQVQYLAAREMAAQNRIPAAIGMLKKTLQQSPNHVASRALLASLHIRQRQLVDAHNTLSAGMKLDPNATKLQILQARLLAEQEETTAAIALLESIQPNAENRLDRTTVLAALYQKQGQYKEAAELYKRELRNTPRSGVLWSGLAMSLDAQGFLVAAMKSYRQSLKIHTLSPALREHAQRRITYLETLQEKQSL